MENNRAPNGEETGQVTSPEEGKRVVLTAPLTEIIDHAGFFIQMGMASMPIWMEAIMNKRYPRWRELEYNQDGAAQSMPAGIRLLETSLLRSFSGWQKDQFDRFESAQTRFRFKFNYVFRI